MKSLLPLLLLPLALGANPVRDAAERIGIDGFGSIERLAYTFHVQLPNREVERSWVWEPKADRVTRTLPDGSSVRYLRSEVDTDAEREVDQQFINDFYWLAFPIAVVWDGQATITDDGEAAMPISGERARKITVAYPAEVPGYTPGDTYVLYLDEADLIREWEFVRGENRRPATFEEYQQFGPLLLALDHRGPDGEFRLWFSDVAVAINQHSIVEPLMPHTLD